jgi:biotin operon repressor
VKDYSRLPNAVWTHASEIGPSGIAVFAALTKHADREGRCWPSIPTLAKLTELSRSTVIVSVANLRRCGLLTSTSGFRGRSEYQLAGYLDEESHVQTSPESRPVTSPESRPVTSLKSDATSPENGSRPVQNLHPNLYLRTKLKNNTATSATKTGGAKPPCAGAAAGCHSPSIEESQSQVLTTMRRFFRLSQQTVDKLIAECREHDPNVTMEEIARGVEDIGNSRSPNVSNIAGLIIKRVPLLFEGEAYRHDKRARQEATEEAAREEEKSAQHAAQREQELSEAEDRRRESERAKHRRETQDHTKTPWWSAREWVSKKYQGRIFDYAIAPLVFDRQENRTIFLWAPDSRVLDNAASMHGYIDDAVKAVGLDVEVQIFCDGDPV